MKRIVEGTSVMDTSEPEMETMMMLHDLSMSRDPHEAAMGRLGKAILPVYADAVTDELKRKTDPAVIACGLRIVSIRMFSTFLATAQDIVGEKMPPTVLSSAIRAYQEDADHMIREACGK